MVLPCYSGLGDMIYSAWAINKPFHASLKCQTPPHASCTETSSEIVTRKYAQHLIKQHEAKNNLLVQTQKFTTVNQNTSKGSYHASLCTNVQNKINSHVCDSNKIVKKQFAHKTFTAKNTSNVKYNESSKYSLIKHSNNLVNSAHLNKQDKTVYNKINGNVKNHHLNEAISNNGKVQLADVKSNSPRTLCREILSTTAKLKQKLEIMNKMKYAKTFSKKDSQFSVHPKLKIEETESCEINPSIKSNTPIQCVNSSNHHKEKSFSNLCTLNSEAVKQNVCKPFYEKASDDKNVDTSILKQDELFCAPKTTVSCKSCVTVSDEEFNNLSNSQSERLLDEKIDQTQQNGQPLCNQITKTFNTKSPLALKGVGTKNVYLNKSEESCKNQLMSTKLINNRSKNSPSMIGLSGRKIAIKKLSARKSILITKYKVVNRADSLRKNIMQENSTIVACIKTPKSNSCSQPFQSSKYKVINKKSHDSSYSENIGRRASFNLPKSLKKKRKVFTKYKVVNRNSPNIGTNIRILESCSIKNDTSTKNFQKDKTLSNKKSEKSTYKIVNKLTPKNKDAHRRLHSSGKRKRVINSRFAIVNKKMSPGVKPWQSPFKMTPSSHSTEIDQKPKSLSSKKTEKSTYKILNKSTPKSVNAHIKKIHSSGKRKRIINSRFAIVNRKNSPREKPWESPFKTIPMVTKRLYKSPRTIINQNISPIHQVARMIKTKYRIVNKNKNQLNKVWQKNSTNSFLTTKKSPGILKRNNLYCANYIYPPKKTSSYSGFKRHQMSQHFQTSGVSYNTSPLKFKRSPRALKYTKTKNIHSSVLFIRGVRFAIDPTGKTLKRLSYGDGKDSKSPRKIVVGGKTFVRVSVDVLKKENMFSKTLASRVLNKSIHTARIALNKKEMTKTNKYCKFYNRFGRCNDGIKCSYIHDPSKIAVCTRFLRGTCKNDSCLFSHEISPGKMALCSFFLLGSCTNVKCPYRHETLTPGTKLCTDFVQGYCCKGKQCKKAHILVCPHYVQGNCENGSQCAYPHPPPKRKKVETDNLENIETTLQVKERKEMNNADDLMEKVSRYFQCDNSSKETKVVNEKKETKNISSVVVSMKCKIPVQPSFIPLSSEENEFRS